MRITSLLLIIFVLAQLNGLFVLDYFLDIQKSALAGKTVVKEEAYSSSNVVAPVVENESSSYIYILIALLFGTALVLLLVRFRQRKLWKLWFFLSVVFTLILSINSWMFRFFGSFVPAVIPSFLLYIVTVIGCLILAYYKIFRHNLYVHNITEIFIYGGLAAFVVPILNIFSVSIILIFVALYDMYAVWKSKHMITMAKFQTEQKVFAGLYIPYKMPEFKQTISIKSAPLKIPVEKKEARTAILGGGDIAFPLLFSGVVMKTTGNYFPALLIIVMATLSLAFLFYIGQKGKFYPAIPFIAVGCFLGYALSFLF